MVLALVVTLILSVRSSLTELIGFDAIGAFLTSTRNEAALPETCFRLGRRVEEVAQIRYVLRLNLSPRLRFMLPQDEAKRLLDWSHAPIVEAGLAVNRSIVSRCFRRPGLTVFASEECTACPPRILRIRCRKHGQTVPGSFPRQCMR